jgi:hypothetical protein
MLNKEYIDYNNKLYWVYRRVKENCVPEGEINNLRDYWLCDNVLRNKNQELTFLVFVREVSEAEIID